MNILDPVKVIEHLPLAIKTMRKEKGLSHQQLADMAGVHRSTISLIESGKIIPTLLVCLKIAQALEVDFRTLLKESL